MSENLPSPLSLYASRYPDPFLDVASTVLPKNQRRLLELCGIFGQKHPQISPIVKKLAKYPITKIVINHKVSSISKKWKEILEKDVDIYTKAEQFGINFFTYGNVFVRVSKPFNRFYECNSCKANISGGRLEYYIRDKEFHATCPKCKKSCTFRANDETITSSKDLNIIFLNPLEMAIVHNELTGINWYFYNVPALIQNAVNSSKPDRRIIDSTPIDFVRAAVEKKKIEFTKNSILHVYDPKIACNNNGWGLPIILPALSDAYLNQVYKKADESGANERVQTARFVYPQPTANNPLQTISLSKWNRFMSDTLKQWRFDKNAIMTSPFPVGVATIGGDAMQNNTIPLRSQQVKEIIGATGVPEGFLNEGMTWSGGSFQVRMLENSMSSYVRGLDKFLAYIVDEISICTSLDRCDATFKPFSRAEDMQIISLLINLAEKNKIAWKEILDRLDISPIEQIEKIKKEQTDYAVIEMRNAALQARMMMESSEINIESQMRQQDYSALRGEVSNDSDSVKNRLMDATRSLRDHHDETVQQASSQPEDPKVTKNKAEAELARAKAKLLGGVVEENEQQDQQGGSNIIDIANGIMSMPESQREMAIMELQEQSPELAIRVLKIVESASGGEILKFVRSNSASPKDMANRILTLKPAQRRLVLRALQKEDPYLAARVMKEYQNQANTSRSSQPNVDMRQLPEQRPPRREN